MMVLLWTVLSCAVAVTAGAFLQPQLRLAAGAVADWGAYSLDLIASALENAADTCGHVTAAARHGIARGGWPVWPLIAAAIALAGAFFFVRGEFTLVESSAAALIAPDTLDAGGNIVEAARRTARWPSPSPGSSWAARWSWGVCPSCWPGTTPTASAPSPGRRPEYGTRSPSPCSGSASSPSCARSPWGCSGRSRAWEAGRSRRSPNWPPTARAVARPPSRAWAHSPSAGPWTTC